jgi:hypothetical protein
MLPAKADVKIESNLTGEEIKMGIDQNSLAFLQKVLTDLYSDPIMAVVREYSTNAWDAHVEAGFNGPIEISTPNSLSPYLKVKDQGVGLSLDDIRNIYSLYGASTKRGTNAQTGMLGLGCKSALTYTNQFTINAVKNGVKTSVVVSRDGDNIGAMTVVYHGTTDLPNGVEISIPVRRGNEREFQNKIKEFFTYWEKDRVLIDGVAPEGIQGHRINAKMFIRTEKRGWNNNNSNKLVMGGVPYNLNADEIFSDRNDQPRLNIGYYSSIVLFVEMGEVEFTPSREELNYTKRTRDKLAELILRFNEDLLAAIRKDIDSQPSHKEALERYFQWASSVSNMPGMSYRNQSIPKLLKFDEFYKISEYSTNRHDKRPREFETLSLVKDAHAVIVTGQRKAVLTTTEKAKLRIWAKKIHGDDNPNFYLSVTDPGAPWTDIIRHVKWQEILDVKIERSASVNNPNSYYRLNYSGREEILESDIDTTKTLLWAHVNDIKGDSIYPINQWMLASNCQLLIVVKSKQEKFKKKFPKAMYYLDYVRQEIASFNATLTPEKLEALGFMFHQNFHAVTFFDQAPIDDKELLRVASLAREIQKKAADPLSDYSKLNKAYRSYENIAHVAGTAGLKSVSNPATVIDKYPLLGYIGNTYRHQLFEHIVLYINAAYKQLGV